MTLCQPTTRTIDSPVGPLVLAACRRGLTHVLFADEDAARLAGDGSPAAQAILREAAAQLDEYFRGRRQEFDLPLAPEGTDFQLAVWRALGAVPYGDTIGYAELAARVGRPRAARAVGAANGANPLSIVVPCHRVIGKDGALVGYGGGLRAKRLLLELEAGAQPQVKAQAVP